MKQLNRVVTRQQSPHVSHLGIMFLNKTIFNYLTYTLLFCLGVYFYPINVKTAEQIGPTFCVKPRMTPRKVDTQNFKKLSPKSLDFCKYIN